MAHTNASIIDWCTESTGRTKPESGQAMWGRPNVCRPLQPSQERGQATVTYRTNDDPERHDSPPRRSPGAHGTPPRAAPYRRTSVTQHLHLRH